MRDLKENVTVFIMKRVVIYFTILALADLLFIKEKWYFLAGLLAGTVFGIFKLNSTISMIKAVLLVGESTLAVRRSIRVYIKGVLGTVILFVVAISSNLWLFWGAVVGILLIAFTVIINSITEGLNITHNNFGN